MPTNNEVVEVNEVPEWKPLAIKASKAGDNAKKAMDIAIDAMKAEGVTLNMFRANEDKSDKAVKFRNHLKAAIIESWPKSKQDLVKLPPGSLSPSQKLKRGDQQRQISSRIKDFRNSFERRMPNTSGPKEKTTDKTFVVTRVDAMIARLRNAEKPRVKDLARFIELMEEAKKLMLN